MDALTAGKLATLVTNDYFELILFPTEQCNFRCSYCYEDFKLGRMSSETIKGIKILMSKRIPQLKIFALSWFGGEPLAARDIVLDISRHAYRLCKKNNVKLVGSMTTNGWFLDPRMMEQLIKVGIDDFQISLDGPKDVHDQTRVRANGKGSFDRIMSNLILLNKTDFLFSITLRIHFSPATVTRIEKWLPTIKKDFGKDDRFSVFFKAVERLGGKNDSKIETFSSTQGASIIKRFKKIFQDDKNGASAKNNSPPLYICYAARPNSLIVRSTGRLAKCTVALNDERNDIGFIKGNGSLSIKNEKLAPWIRGLDEMDPNSLACPLSNIPL